MPARLVAAFLLVPLGAFLVPLEPHSPAEDLAAAENLHAPAESTSGPEATRFLVARPTLQPTLSPWVVPSWKPGQWWEYLVDRPPHPTEVMRCGVVWAGNDTARFACDSFRERAYNLIDEGPFLPAGDPYLRLHDGVIEHAAGEADLLGFDEPARGAWIARLFHKDLVMVHTPLTAAADVERGVQGVSADGLRLNVTFDAEVGWFRLLSVHDDNGLRVRYTLVDHGTGGILQATRWQLLSQDAVVATTDGMPLSSRTLQSNGSADRVVMLVGSSTTGAHGEQGARAAATIVGPQGAPQVRTEDGQERSAVVAIASDRAGSWHATASASGAGDEAYAEAWAYLLRVRIVPAGPAPTVPAV